MEKPNALRKHADGRIRYTPLMNAVLRGGRAPAATLLELGMTARSELEARFLVNALQMAAHALGERAHGVGS